MKKMKNRKTMSKVAVDKRRVSRNRTRINRAVDISALRRQFRDFAENEAWDEMIKTIQPMLMEKPRDHWLLTQKASAYLFKHDYNSALMYAVDALTIEMNCPMAKLIFAHALASQGQLTEAAEFWKSAIRGGVRHLVHGRCGEGSDCNISMTRAKLIVDDAIFMTVAAYLQFDGFPVLNRTVWHWKMPECAPSGLNQMSDELPRDTTTEDQSSP